MKKTPPAYWAGSTRMPFASDYLHGAIALELNNAVSASRLSSRGVSKKHLEVQLAASKWLLEALYQGYCCLPRLPVALPLMRGDYSPSAIYNLPYGYEVVSRVVKAAKTLGFIKIKKGKYNPSGKGVVTRLFPVGTLLSYFRHTETIWQKLRPPSKGEGILVNLARGKKGRRLAMITDHPDIARMQRNLYEINLFLSKQCISIYLPDSVFDQPADKFYRQKSVDSVSGKGLLDGLPTINFQNVFLSRIFTKDSFTAGHELGGGRFYHGWWQNIRKELRSRIIINDYLTAECDYSGMALSCLYAQEGLEIGNDDPYDIGINYTDKNDPRRDFVKQYVVAILNDKNGKYRLDQKELNVLGLTHLQLHDMVRRRHGPISHYFGTGVGLRLQYLDSCIAEGVMLKLIRMKEVCLPIHDSFIVRKGLVNNLEKIMKEEFLRHLRKNIDVKKSGFAISDDFIERLFLNQSAATVPADPTTDIAMRFARLLAPYSWLMGFHSTWERRVFNEAELEGRSRMIEMAFDFGKRGCA